MTGRTWVQQDYKRPGRTSYELHSDTSKEMHTEESAS